MQQNKTANRNAVTPLPRQISEGPRASGIETTLRAMIEGSRNTLVEIENNINRIRQNLLGDGEPDKSAAPEPYSVESALHDLDCRICGLAPKIQSLADRIA
jgi:hypothetical protein